ncbi:bifunctional nuclease family protein, partial [bacterium]|nr:bifunctional nuclease family protein [bacterium]
MIPVEVTGVSVCQPYQGYVVILREISGDRWLPIFIGAAEAQNISLLLQGTPHTRPLTFDLFYNLLHASDAIIRQVAVTDLKDNTFFAMVELQTMGGIVGIDARPSDAIAIALKAKAPVFVVESVMDKASLKGNEVESQVSNLDEISRLSQLLLDAVQRESYGEAAQ